MKKIILLFSSMLIMGFILPQAFAEQREIKNFASEEYRFTKDYIDVLSQLQIAVEKIQDAGKQSNENEDFLKTQVFFKNFNMAINNVRLAESFLKPYQNTKNEIIKSVVDGTLPMLDLLAQNINGSMDKMQYLYSNELAQHPEKIDQGKFLRESGELLAQRDELLKQFTFATPLVAHALVDLEPTKENETIKYIKLTSREVDELKNSLVNLWGDNIKKGIKENPEFIAGSASLLYGFLSENWIPLDKR